MTKMILVYIVIVLDCVLITLGEDRNVHAKNHKLEGKIHARGEQEADSDAKGTRFTVVHQDPDVHVLHVHIHETNQCKNGGVMKMCRNCVFKCLCPPKYGGPLCEDTLFCYHNPCKNGGTCQELGKGYKCICPEGFDGYTCEERKFCKPNPCGHHAKCVETLQNFKCICDEGYKGEKCQDVDPCSPNPCKNNGVCKEEQGLAKCECAPPYKGTFCTEILICYHNPCHHGGKCVENPTAPCVCPKGYIGTYCEDHVCKPNPCVNGGVCNVVKGNGHQQWTFKCVCPRGYDGKLCQIPNPCVDFVCFNGGTCIDGMATQDAADDSEIIYPHVVNVFCKCLPGFTGKRCENNICDLCDKNAVCINKRCVCKKNFVGNGYYCKEIDDPCKPNPCKNEGVCILGPDRSYTCECIKGYCGPHCESLCDPCASNPCKNNGTCTANGYKYTCTCPPGFTGVNCELTITNPCNSQPCANGGTCDYDPVKNEYRCICKGMFTGKNCQDCGCKDGRTPLGEVLRALCDLEGGCYCALFKGRNPTYLALYGCRLVEENPCFPNPCKNNGSCRANEPGAAIKYTCLCQEKYYGQQCECTECTCNKPCINNGVCVDIGTHVFKCNCPPGYTGLICQDIIPTVRPGACRSNLCLHGGTCVDRAFGSYDCICTPQYTGPHCEVDKCANCDVNADCVLGSCRCRKGYIGTGYVCVKEDKGKGCELVVCPIHYHCVRGDCVCLPGLDC